MKLPVITRQWLESHNVSLGSMQLFEKYGTAKVDASVMVRDLFKEEGRCWDACWLLVHILPYKKALKAVTEVVGTITYLYDVATYGRDKRPQDALDKLKIYIAKPTKLRKKQLEAMESDVESACHYIAEARSLPSSAYYAADAVLHLLVAVSENDIGHAAVSLHSAVTATTNDSVSTICGVSTKQIEEKEFSKIAALMLEL